MIVQDRGYYSFAMAPSHRERGLHFVIASGDGDRIVTVEAPRDGPSLQGRTLRVRLVRHVAGDTEYRGRHLFWTADTTESSPSPTSTTDNGASSRCTEARP